jgi:lipid-A-disaccharide synthase
MRVRAVRSLYPLRMVTHANSPSSTPHNGPVIALIAGEASGDQLGADLVAALRLRYPHARFVGVGGPRMAAVGFEAWHDIAELSVMGFAEVVRHLPRLLKLRRTLARQLLALRPDVVVGIDAPDFNLGLERTLRQAGIRTVHYVSPSVWAWREQRAEKIGRSADRVLCLFPMEPPIYARHGVDARFVGHPLANRFPLVADRAAARDALGLPHDVPVLAVLPGSRHSEIERLGAIFLDAARRVGAGVPGLRVIVPAANARCRATLEDMLGDSGKASGPGSRVPGPEILDGHAHEAMLAADVVLLASGTATLEAMLAKRPMVVGYRVAPASYRIARALRMLKTDIYALPNILARAAGLGRIPLVPELMQDDCTAPRLADAVLALFHDSERRGNMVAVFEHLHLELQGGLEGDAADHAAAAIAELIDPQRTVS